MKIAILLPEDPDLGWVWRAQAIARALTDSADGVEVVVGLPVTAEKRWREMEPIVGGQGQFVVRHLGWERIDTDLAKRMFPAFTANIDDLETVVIPRDWGWNMMDCDGWVVCADPRLGAVAPLKPTVHYVRDVAQRYVPSAFAANLQDSFWNRELEAFRVWRQSTCVFAADEATVDDIVGYAGVRRLRTLIVPQLMPDAVPTIAVGSEKALLWLTEPSALHDIGTAAEGVRLYRREGGTMRIIAAGERVGAFKGFENSALVEQLEFPARQALEALQIECIGDEPALRRLLARVSAVWSSAIADGENEGAIRAAQCGVPFLGFSYPQNARITKRLGISAHLYIKSDPLEIADALHQIETLIGSNLQPVVERPHLSQVAYRQIVERFREGIVG